MYKKKDLLGLKDMTAEEIIGILDHAKSMKEAFVDGRQLNSLSGKCVTTLFYENSTRTRNSFETAARFLGARTMSVAVATSSVQKGESLIDTGKTLDALRTDAIVIRHSMAGGPGPVVADRKYTLVNPRDGFNAPPTQKFLHPF